MLTRVVVYTFGCGLFSCGAFLFILSDLGTDPLDVFALGLRNHLPITVGIAQAGVAVLCLVIVAVWTRRHPVFSPILTFFVCGSMIDLLLLTDASWTSSVSSYLILAAGTVLCAYGSALIIMSNFGIRAIDLLAIVMTRLWGWPFWAAKGSIEMTLLLTGGILGGPAGIGTVVFLIGVDLLIQPSVLLNVRVLRIPNLGMPDRRVDSPVG
jgi:uncharacterized membrane protein YczE